ncbi:MAG: hypothetical protein U1E38_05210 [Rhodospirillales bacterium]
MQDMAAMGAGLRRARGARRAGGRGGGAIEQITDAHLTPLGNDHVQVGG